MFFFLYNLLDTEKNVEMEDLVDEFFLFYLAGICYFTLLLNYAYY